MGRQFSSMWAHPSASPSEDALHTSMRQPALLCCTIQQPTRTALLHHPGANEISASAVGLVYLFAIGPTIIVKLTAPHWFHLVSYSTRFWVAAALMSCSFIIVGCSNSMAVQVGATELHKPEDIACSHLLAACFAGALATQQCTLAKHP
eukprot:GHRQ01022148.1.p1 GENE.GHRQ01022148.1~~GHRQ01022148.1.p1  ORF type:complete len:149 (+),score=30.61 GHRQ01022148.1:418-864(+)